MAEDSGTAAPDPRIEAILDHEWPLIEDHSWRDAHRSHTGGSFNGWCKVCRGDVPAMIAVADAADRAAGVIRVRVDDAKRMAIELAMVEALADMHTRYPDGIKSSHIAVFLTAAALRVLAEP